MKDLEPTTPQEYILKGVVNAALGQEQNSKEHLKIAQQYFQLVGGSASECGAISAWRFYAAGVYLSHGTMCAAGSSDTIPGRQCMASCFFLLSQFDDVLTYLESIKVAEGSLGTRLLLGPARG